MQDDETGEMLDVKIRCSKKINDALEGPNPAESKKYLINVWKNYLIGD